MVLLYLREEQGAVVFKVRVQPRAAKNELAGPYEDALRIRLTAPPVEGEANEACRTFLARQLGVHKGQVEIVAGHTGRTKFVRVQGVSSHQVLSLIKGD